MKDKTEFLGYEEHEYNPIIRKKTLELLKELLIKHNPKYILEIGTFIGYSTAVMLETCQDAFVTTVEKDEKNFAFAVQNLTDLGFDGRFQVVNKDAFEFLQKTNKTYDFIFLDGPKGQYIKYLPIIKKLLRKGGFLVADDVLFYGMVNSSDTIKHKHRSIVNNLRKFLDALKNDDDFKTVVYEFEDGVSVSEKIK